MLISGRRTGGASIVLNTQQQEEPQDVSQLQDVNQLQDTQHEMAVPVLCWTRST